MTVVRYSIAHGRPASALKRKVFTVTWCAWWKCEPHLEPLTPPDAFGGARARADVPAIVQHHADCFRVEGPLEELPARWCQAFRRTQRMASPLSEAEQAERAARFEEFRRLYGHLMRPITAPSSDPPAWARALGLSWPTFTETDLASAFRARAFEAHPDRGGSHEAFVALTHARDAALAQLGAT